MDKIVHEKWHMCWKVPVEDRPKRLVLTSKLGLTTKPHLQQWRRSGHDWLSFLDRCYHRSTLVLTDGWHPRKKNDLEHYSQCNPHKLSWYTFFIKRDFYYNMFDTSRHHVEWKKYSWNKLCCWTTSRRQIGWLYHFDVFNWSILDVYLTFGLFVCYKKLAFIECYWGHFNNNFIHNKLLLHTWEPQMALRKQQVWWN